MNPARGEGMKSVGATPCGCPSPYAIPSLEGWPKGPGWVPRSSRYHLPLKSNERLDDIVRLGRHHSERGLDLCKGKPMGGQRCGVNAPVLKQPQQT